MSTWILFLCLRHLFDGELVARVDVLSAVNFTVGAFFDELGANVLPRLLVLRVDRLDFLTKEKKRWVCLIGSGSDRKRRSLN